MKKLSTAVAALTVALALLLAAPALPQNITSDSVVAAQGTQQNQQQNNDSDKTGLWGLLGLLGLGGLAGLRRRDDDNRGGPRS
jgi:MYXO-CTERM domain-containing protein